MKVKLNKSLDFTQFSIVQVISKFLVDFGPLCTVNTLKEFMTRLKVHFETSIYFEVHFKMRKMQVKVGELKTISMHQIT